MPIITYPKGKNKFNSKDDLDTVCPKKRRRFVGIKHSCTEQRWRAKLLNILFGDEKYCKFLQNMLASSHPWGVSLLKTLKNKTPKLNTLHNCIH